MFSQHYFQLDVNTVVVLTSLLLIKFYVSHLLTLFLPVADVRDTSSFNLCFFLPYFLLWQVSVTLKELGLDNPTGYHIEDLYDDHVYGIVTPDRRFKVDVNPSGSKCCIYFRIQSLRKIVSEIKKNILSQTSLNFISLLRVTFSIFNHSKFIF